MYTKTTKTIRKKWGKTTRKRLKLSLLVVGMAFFMLLFVVLQLVSCFFFTFNMLYTHSF